ncbi:major capsid protein [Dipodfec virus UA23Rod_920]|uniref:Major capsid protein n=1 Tax=Dipodfec virus UA23Rod_920 TaxID=2929334 RepID=A0A976R8Q9_9VIRU|nr:major capsid protein [Dipodfec virus UA23Rod_920]
MQYNISPSASVSSQVSLSNRNLTTIDFNQILPIQSMECIIGDKHHVSINQFTRCSPLVVPTYGNYKLGFVSFFVPYYQVYPDFDTFYSGTDSVGSSSLKLPSFSLFGLVLGFLDASLSEMGSETSYDFVYYPSATAPVYRRFTANGRYVYKILQLLGYSFTQAMLQSGTINSIKLNALPFLCFLKAFNDWMSLSSIYDSSLITTFLRNVRNGGDITTILSNFLPNLARIVRPLVGSDFFTSAYNSYNQSVANNVRNPLSRGFKENLNPITDHINVDFQLANDYGVYNELPVDAGNGILSLRQLKFLQSFQKFLSRNELAGTRAAQRIFARFGLKSEDFRSNYAHILGSRVIDFNVADVTSTSPNSNPSLGLGTYSGQSVSSGDFSFDVECSDFGHLFTFAYLDVNSQYLNSISPEVLRSSPLDFYQPDFDGVGFQPICYAQLYNNPKSIASDPTTSKLNSLNPLKSVFGFQPRYEEYRTSYSRVTGDFVLLDSMDSWHFGRKLDSTQDSATFGNLVPQSYAFQFSDEWRRIFTSEVVPDGFDHFFSAFNIDVKSTRRIKSRAGSLDLPDGQISVSSLGRTVQQN